MKQWDEALADVEEAIKRSLGLGASTKTSVAGDSRENQEVPLKVLEQRKSKLIRLKRRWQYGGGVRLRPKH